MLRSRLYRYKLSEFSYLTGIDTYRLKKLDQQGILKANILNGRRYYDETAVMLAAFYNDREFSKPNLHHIVIAISKLLTLIKVYNKNNNKQIGLDFELLHEDVLRENLDKKLLEDLDVRVTFDHLIKYLEQVRCMVNLKDVDNLIEDDDLPIVIKKGERSC